MRRGKSLAQIIIDFGLDENEPTGPLCLRCRRNGRFDDGLLCESCLEQLDMCAALRGEYGPDAAREAHAAVRAGHT